jgi:hypothetical protein
MSLPLCLLRSVSYPLSFAICLFPFVSSPLSLHSVSFLLTNFSVSCPPSLLSVFSPLSPKSDKHIYHTVLCTSFPRPCFSPCRAALGSGTGLPVWEGGISANLRFLLLRSALSLFSLSFFLHAFVVFFGFALARAKKEHRHPTLIIMIRIR